MNCVGSSSSSGGGKRTNLHRAHEADQANLAAARRVMELWDRCGPAQQMWATACVERLGTAEDRAKMEELKKGLRR